MRTLWQPPGAQHPIEVGDWEEVARICGRRPGWGKTYARYARRGVPKSNPAPRAVAVDYESRRDLYPLDEVRAWNHRRLGPGTEVKL